MGVDRPVDINMWHLSNYAEVQINITSPSAINRYFGRAQATAFTAEMNVSEAEYRVSGGGPQGRFEYTTERVNCVRQGFERHIC